MMVRPVRRRSCRVHPVTRDASSSLCFGRVNDDMAAQQKRYPDRIRFMASVPWEHAKLAVVELKRACDLGAVGVMVMANINGNVANGR